MKPSISEKLIAYLALLSGLSISAVAVYYSVIGLTAIFAAAAIPIIIMGIALEVSKLVATVWLKQNWQSAPRMIKFYLTVSVIVLMLITSMGIFGFLSKAHLDQGVPTGDVVDRVALIDEKIRTQRENIDAAKRALKQMDESVDQIMARSSDERGADKAAALRRSQQKERNLLQKDIGNAQAAIATLNEERAPIAKELRKVEAEVGPIKYIAAFIYGDTDQRVLEKAVTWVIITLIVVFDPLAVILLLAAQTSFQQFRIREQGETLPVYVVDVDDPPTKEEKAEIEAEVDSPKEPEPVVNDQKPTVEEFDISKHPYLDQGFGKEHHPPGIEPVPPQVYKPEVKDETTAWPTEWKAADPIAETVPAPVIQPPKPLRTSQGLMMRTKVFPRPSVVIPLPEEPVAETAPEVQEPLFVQNEEQKESNLWSSTVQESAIDSEEYHKAVQAKKEEEIKNYAEMVRTKQIQMEDVPEEYQYIVKTKV